MLAPDATVVTAGEEEFPFLPGIMDFLSQSSNLLSTQMPNLPLQRDVKESGFPRLKDKQKTHFQGSKYTLHTMQGVPHPALFPLSGLHSNQPAQSHRTGSPNPPKADKMLSSLWRCPAGLQTKPRQSGSRFLASDRVGFLPDWYFKKWFRI